MGALLAVGALTGACSDDDDRPPVRPACTGDDCGGPAAPGTPGSGGTTGAGGTDSGGAGGEDRVTLAGSIVQYTETQFVQVTGFAGPGTLEVHGDAGLLTEGSFTQGSFTLPEIDATPVVWALARPDSEAIHFPTWSALPATASTQLTVPLLPRSLVEEVMNALAVPAIPAQGTAQVLLRILDANQAPVEGVVVAAPAAQLVLYAAQGTWSDVENQTDLTGLVLLGNVAASAPPGNDLQLTLSGAASGSALVRVANDTATVVDLRSP